MNMYPRRLETAWFILNDEFEGIEMEDAEWMLEQWWAEIEGWI